MWHYSWSLKRRNKNSHGFKKFVKNLTLFGVIVQWWNNKILKNGENSSVSDSIRNLKNRETHIKSVNLSHLRFTWHSFRRQAFSKWNEYLFIQTLIIFTYLLIAILSQGIHSNSIMKKCLFLKNWQVKHYSW